MKHYEIMFIVRPDIDENAVKNTVKTFEKILTDKKAKITLSKELGNLNLVITFYTILRLKMILLLKNLTE